MAFKIFPLVAALLAVLLVAQTVSCEENSKQPTDILFIANPDTNPEIISASSALLGASRNSVCTATMCNRACVVLGFRFGYCNIFRVCTCSN